VNVFAIVVTYNRRLLLERCLSALSRQTRTPDRVIVIDNASTDGTAEWLQHWLPISLPYGDVRTLDENTGGAGGFSEGLRTAVAKDADWVWMMDDDACPHPAALEELLKVADDTGNIYGSLAVNGECVSWSTTLLDDSRIVRSADDVPPTGRVAFIPLLGFLIHRSLVKKIGFPDAAFFIAADDVEYCLRAQRAGADIIISGRSRIEHPRTQLKNVSCFGVKIAYLGLAPWKRYYDTRNRLLVARKYYGLRLLTEAVPGSFVRLYVALRYESRKLAQLWAWCCGMFDGLLGIKGKRHEKWGIRQ
jgi:GT2 family glycosyltransferase